MGYLNNSTRTLDAILTKRGREILAGDTGTAERVGFSITKFALGDDEIDYGLWDTSHAKGTDYYGAVLENLPPLEPFNDPSEIMKYKLVSRPKGTRAMPFIKKDSSTLNIPTIKASYVHTGRSTVIAPNQIAVDIGHGVPLGPWKTHIDTSGTPIPTNWDTDTQNEALAEQYLITLLDVSVGILGPNIYETETTINEERFVEGNWLNWSGIYLDEQRSMSQTISYAVRLSNDWYPAGNEHSIMLYPKKTETRYTIDDPVKTKLLITGLTSGAVVEINVEIYYATS